MAATSPVPVTKQIQISLSSLSLPKPKPSCTGLRWGWLWPTPTPFIEAWTGPSLGSFAHRQDKWRINKLLFGPFLQYQNVTADSGQDRTGLDMARRGEEEPNGTELCERSLCPLAVDFLVVFLLSPHNVVVAGAAASNSPPALLTKLLKRQSIVQSCRSCLTCFKLTDEDEPTCTIYGPCSRWRKPTSPSLSPQCPLPFIFLIHMTKIEKSSCREREGQQEQSPWKWPSLDINCCRTSFRFEANF